MPKKQTRKQIDHIITQYPGIYSVLGRRDNPDLKKTTSLKVVVQRPDNELMLRQANNIYRNDMSYTTAPEFNDDRRGDRREYVCAVDQADRIIAEMTWPRVNNDIMVKDIFQRVIPERVRYLLWVSIINWYSPPTLEQREQDILFGNTRLGEEITIIVYPKRTDINWNDLVKKALQEKQDLENAWKLNPKFMPEYPGIHEALRSGLRMHAFSSGGGLRVVNLKKGKDEDTQAYGEAPHIEDALVFLEEDYLAGGRRYEDVYGPIHKHYLTGSQMATSNLDFWVRRGSNFDVWFDGENIVFELTGSTHQEIPKWVLDISKENPNIPQSWGARGFTFETTYHPVYFANGGPGHSTSVVNKTDEKARNDFFYKIKKTGFGPSFWEAMIAAFNAPEEEIFEK